MSWTYLFRFSILLAIANSQSPPPPIPHVINCDYSQACYQANDNCAPNRPCYVNCIGDQACKEATFNAQNSLSVTITCGGQTGGVQDCTNATFNCPINGPCNLACGDTDSCNGTILECAVGQDCTLQCPQPQSCESIDVRLNDARSFWCTGECNFAPPNQSPNPTASPIKNPTTNPTINPSIIPSENPSIIPSLFPTMFPTISTVNPSINPSKIPTETPTQSGAEIHEKTTINEDNLAIDGNGGHGKQKGNINGMIVAIIGVICGVTLVVLAVMYLVKKKKLNKVIKDTNINAIETENIDMQNEEQTIQERNSSSDDGMYKNDANQPETIGNITNMEEGDIDSCDELFNDEHVQNNTTKGDEASSDGMYEDQQQTEDGHTQRS